ncbi:MAG: sigma-70 family RNA polymerase sigma factor [Chroococcidiopsidaceae cyanobacterium CP_BM_RX_35]|nr:sigma-70 family RNA polymerase sigma factor [Chroococcidiopsidaceae cyanobacterium CP_BM_RX_35]
MDEMEERLRQMVQETCRCKPSSIERQRSLTQIIRLIVSSGKLWKENSPYYEDALQQTWIYFCRNLCEATTADKYDRNLSSVITWLNAYLKRRLQDGRIQVQLNQNQTTTKTKEDYEPIDVMEALEAPADIPPILEITRHWAQTDPDGELRRIHIQGHPKVTCQVLILQRLPPETSWEAVATQFGLSVSTLSSFYRRQCFPRLRQFGKSQGYI